MYKWWPVAYGKESLTMHPALSVHHVLVEILSHLSPISFQPNPQILPVSNTSPRNRSPKNIGTFVVESEHRHEKQRTLKSLALTCKTISGPALDLLWEAPHRGMHSLLELFARIVEKQPGHRKEYTVAFKATFHPVSSTVPLRHQLVP